MDVRVVHSDGEVNEEDGHHSADKDKDNKDDHGSSESESENEEPPVKRQKKMLTSNRLVNSLDNSLDPKYDEITLPKNTTGSNEVEMLTGYFGTKSKQDTPKIYWTADPPSLTGRQRLCDVIKGNIATVRL